MIEELRERIRRARGDYNGERYGERYYDRPIVFSGGDSFLKSVITIGGLIVTGALAWSNLNSEVRSVLQEQERLRSQMSKLSELRESDAKSFNELRFEIQRMMNEVRSVATELRTHIGDTRPLTDQLRRDRDRMNRQESEPFKR